MAGDLAPLRAWAASVSAPVVLVPEHSDGRAWVPTRLLLRLAADLVGSIGAGDATLRTVPLEPHDPLSDSAIVDRIARRLGATAVHSLSDTSPADTATAWASARAALVDGRDAGPLVGVEPGTEAALRAWLPRRGQRGVALMFSGLSGSGKSTLARDVAAWMGARTTRTVTLLDGDRVRQMLSAGLGFDQASRELNVRRIGYVAAEIARHGGIAICSPIAPFAHTREEVRHMVEQAGDFVLVHVSTPIEECERRDLKGLYAQARQGRIPEFTGISSPYDVPTDADLRVDTSALGREEAAQQVIDYLTRGGWVQAGAS
jgi:sulfate adenylyltransferase